MIKKIFQNIFENHSDSHFYQNTEGKLPLELLSLWVPIKCLKGS